MIYFACSYQFVLNTAIWQSALEILWRYTQGFWMRLLLYYELKLDMERKQIPLLILHTFKLFWKVHQTETWLIFTEKICHKLDKGLSLSGILTQQETFHFGLSRLLMRGCYGHSQKNKIRNISWKIRNPSLITTADVTGLKPTTTDGKLLAIFQFSSFSFGFHLSMRSPW